MHSPRHTVQEPMGLKPKLFTRQGSNSPRFRGLPSSTVQ